MPPAREIYCSKSVKYGVVGIVKVQCSQLIMWEAIKSYVKSIFVVRIVTELKKKQA